MPAPVFLVERAAQRDMDRFTCPKEYNQVAEGNDTCATPRSGRTNSESEIESNGRKYRRILVKTHFIKEGEDVGWVAVRTWTISTSPAITSSS